jgi:hypothetical protein
MSVPEMLPQMVFQDREGAEMRVEVIEWNAESPLEKRLSPPNLPGCRSRLVVQIGLGFPCVPLRRHVEIIADRVEGRGG